MHFKTIKTNTSSKKIYDGTSLVDRANQIVDDLSQYFRIQIVPVMSGRCLSCLKGKSHAVPKQF